jgi:Mg2+/Co2+ transporter CorB
LSGDVPLSVLFGILIVLLVVSAFCSCTETALMSLNRYRLRHSARSGHRAARVAELLLQRPDRLIGVILLYNNAANIGAASLATVIALRIGGEDAILATSVVLTVVVLIFAEVAPKTIGALHSTKVALPAALIYYPLLKITYPVVWLLNVFANGLLRLLGIRADQIASHTLSAEELRTIVAEAGIMVPRRHQRMLLSILDLDAMTVDDVMVPRQDIVGIDLDRDWHHNLAIIRDSQFHRLPVFRGDVDNTLGIVQIRRLLPYLAGGTLDEHQLLQLTREPYFVPEGTPLNKQLLNFQQHERRSAFVVDEYGDVQGLITTEDILREIVGEFDRSAGPADIGIVRENELSFVVNAGANVRQLNRVMTWSLPTDGPKTLNGLLIEKLETIPKKGAHVRVGDYQIEILETTEHGIESVRVRVPPNPPIEHLKAAND